MAGSWSRSLSLRPRAGAEAQKAQRDTEKTKKLTTDFTDFTDSRGGRELLQATGWFERPPCGWTLGETNGLWVLFFSSVESLVGLSVPWLSSFFPGRELTPPGGLLLFSLSLCGLCVSGVHVGHFGRFSNPSTPDGWARATLIRERLRGAFGIQGHCFSPQVTDAARRGCW